LGAGEVQVQPDEEQDEGEAEDEAQETEADEEDGGGFLGTNCPLSTVALPLLVFAAAMHRKRRKNEDAF
ncbi:MAG: hypothetical protein MUO76_07975, partial [Anaerolineaceae bacterium]|nr:hypothetical protein [Anaerolineaceae bacterium]